MKKSILVVLVVFLQLSLVAQDYKFGKVSKEELEEEFYPLDSTADAAYLYKYRRSFFNYSQNQGFQLITEIHHRIKIYTKEGFDYATTSIKYYKPDSGDSESVSSIKGYTFYLENGKLIKEKLSKEGIFKEKINKYNSSVKITMPKIKEGCVLDIKYKISSPYATSIADIQFQKGIPIKKLSSQVEFPEYYKFNKMNKGYYMVPMKESSKTGRIGDLSYRINVFYFDGKDIPALRNDESYVANIYNYRGGMKFELAQTDFLSIGGDLKNYSTTWENISKQIYESSSFGNELNKSSYYKDDLAKILAENTTENQKIVAIFEFVKSKVKWNGFYGKYSDKGVKTAYKENSGNVADINLILTSMLRSAGLNANPVLISSQGNGVPFFPTLKGFDYVISVVQMANNTNILLDATEQYSTPNILPIRALNWQGRVVAENGNSSWIKLSTEIHATEENMIMVKITDDFMIEGLIRTKYGNLNALNFRKNNNHLKEEELITKYEENNNLEIEDFKIVNKEKLEKQIIRNVKFTNEDLIEQIGNKLYIEPSLFLTKRKNPFKLSERKYPIDFATAWQDKNIVSINIPDGYAVEKLPETLAIGLPNNYGIFKYHVTQNGNKIKTVSVLQFNSSIIPVQFYAYLKDFYGKMVQKQTEKIVLVKQ
ncbi:transglutaminase-like domain-containing protein [Polaribacter vadi]|uniref:transglutaminase-like domain-containing protein n=1 Tax=Polaribacter TaxID=52959 RepID=UPI001C091D2A|nr:MULTISPECIES: transglutaminase-like domain-containing protein [Polaribacter]MBU3010504.1 transglutaminase-like domain-containing protein [Polaribacter vadi]MDO6740312.1 transglutaminase-like domain-containing protein [Polaribacter sp. 1_MG-2023]